MVTALEATVHIYQLGSNAADLHRCSGINNAFGQAEILRMAALSNSLRVIGLRSCNEQPTQMVPKCLVGDAPPPYLPICSQPNRCCWVER